jgi:hypothetical protein
MRGQVLEVLMLGITHSIPSHIRGRRLVNEVLLVYASAVIHEIEN